MPTPPPLIIAVPDESAMPVVPEDERDMRYQRYRKYETTWGEVDMLHRARHHLHEARRRVSGSHSRIGDFLMYGEMVPDAARQTLASEARSLADAAASYQIVSILRAVFAESNPELARRWDQLMDPGASLPKKPQS
ncbi:hypothetical protein E3_1840 [Rhodococcus phage E3]|uniref:hypothetical protein n=1 Tax=Rhodococcus phage E3 TaxID=1007869 RepID=UPI0002C6B2D8|nr:hypothetical protein M176_gp194 [Rhodococcus phage E3]AEQ21102.1 hypothetical protein E3_1840 [Rhodococcus phage E3]